MSTTINQPILSNFIRNPNQMRIHPSKNGFSDALLIYSYFTIFQNSFDPFFKFQ